MAIPTLTSNQLFQNSVNSVPIILAQSLNVNNPQGLTALYNKLHTNLFSNSNGTAAAAMTNLGTGAANVMSILAAMNTFLTAGGVTGLSAIPAYTANNDGTVTLT